jgi:hypothetical protein
MNIPAFQGINRPVRAAQSGTRQAALTRRSFVLLALAALVLSGLCLKACPMPFVWFWLFWAVAFLGLIFCVRGSWPRALLFNAGVAAATLAAAEVYFLFQEREDPFHDREYPTYTPKLRVKDEILGWAPAKGMRTRATLFHHGRPVYDVTQTIDSNGLRISAPAGKAPPDGTVIFFGCSFTFGDGLQDDETLPYQVCTQSRGRWRAINFAFGSYGPHQMLAAIEDGRVRRVVDSRPRYAIYVAIIEHGARAGRQGQDGAPRYRLDPDGEPRLNGHFHDEGRAPGFLGSHVFRIIPGAAPWLRWQLGKSSIYRKTCTRNAATTLTTLDDIHLSLAIVRKSRELLLEDYPGLEFHVIFWPTQFTQCRALHREMLDGFRQLNMPVHRVEEILPGYDLEVPDRYQTRYVLAPSDWHPNALANRLLAQYVVTKILPAESGAVDPER